MNEAIGIIIPARDAASRVGVALRDWSEHFRRVGQPHAFYVVCDDSTDDTPGIVERLREKNPAIHLFRNEKPQGFGACLRTAMPSVVEPLVAVLTLDYAYKPQDLDVLLSRLDQPVEVFGAVKRVTIVSGWRTGHSTPALWKAAGICYRLCCRIALGFKPEPLAGWLGFRNHWRSWWLWAVMGVPLFDITSGLKVFRRDLFERFPIQSDGDFAHAELIAKLTFLGALIAEEPLPPRKDSIPVTDFSGFLKVFRNARFNSPASECSGVRHPQEQEKLVPEGRTPIAES